MRYFLYFVENYIDTQKSITQKTKDDWKHTTDNYIAKAFPRVPLDKVTTEDLQSFVNQIDKERKREIIFQRIVRVFKKAYITGKIKNDVTAGLEKPERTDVKERPPLTLEEQQALLSRAKSSNVYAFVMFSIIIGSRREETIRFNFANDVDEAKRIIYINETKEKKTRRRVYTTDAFIKFLKDNLPNGRFGFRLNYPTKKVGDLMEELGIDNCLHGLRHTCSANLYFLGAKDKYRQMQLGHASIVTTNDIYTNIKENIAKSDLLELYGELYPRFD